MTDKYFIISYRDVATEENIPLAVFSSLWMSHEGAKAAFNRIVDFCEDKNAWETSINIELYNLWNELDSSVTIKGKRDRSRI